MKIQLRKSIYILLFIMNSPLSLNGADSLKYCISIKYYRDLSDTYGKGTLFSGDFEINKSWYGVNMNFGYYQARSTFIYKIIVEEIDKTIEIRFDEISMMKSSSISLFVIPLQNNRLQVDVSLGAAFNKATSSQFNNVDYNYDLNQDKFIYLYRDYKLVNKIHFGYQVGFNISVYITKEFGLQLSSRIQDLSNGGTFFLVGGGLCFRL